MVETLIVYGEQYGRALDYLALASCWFEVTPLPDDAYELKFKSGEGHMFRVIDAINGNAGAENNG